MEFSNRKIIWGLIVLQLVVCLPFINSFPIALDEPFSIFYAQQDFSDMKSLFINENNPPLHFILLHFWVNVFGISAFSVRVLSLLFGVIVIPILYTLSSKILNKRYSVVIVCFFILSNFHHYHNMEARVYSLLVFLYTYSIYKLFKIVFNSNNSLNDFVFYAILNTLLLYSHYLGGVILLFQTVIILFFLKELSKKKRFYLFVSYVLTITLYSPGLYLLYIRLGHFSKEGTWLRSPLYSELYGNVLRFFNGKEVFLSLVGLIVLLMIINKKYLLKELLLHLQNKMYFFCFLSFAVPYFGMFIFSKIFQPIFLDRYLLFCVPFLFISFIILFKYFFDGLGQKNMIFLILIPLVVSFHLVPDNNREPDKLVEFISDNINNQSIILICPPFYDITFLYHYDIEKFKDYKMFDENKHQSKIQSIYKFEEISRLSENNRVIYVDANSSFLGLGTDIIDNLNNSFLLISNTEFKGGFKISIFDKKR